MRLTASVHAALAAVLSATALLSMPSGCADADLDEPELSPAEETSSEPADEASEGPPRASYYGRGAYGVDNAIDLEQSYQAAIATANAEAKPATFRNPLVTNAPDPWMAYHEGYYYLAATTWSSELTMRKSKTIAGLKTAQPVVIWRGDNASRCCNFWAPEFHLLNGPSGKRWYFYFSGGPAGTNTDRQRNFVLESRGTDPMGPYTFKARIFDPKNDVWSIDASVVTIDGKLYFLFSAWEGQDQGVYIAPMSNPWTLSGSRVRIGRPTKSWETKLARVNEAPVALQRGGKTFVIFSASACWGPDYKLGMLTFQGGNPLNARNWLKSEQPVFQRADQNRAFGPGHNGFFKSPDGKEDWIVYHANASAQGVCDTKRTTRAQKINWRADGTPDFGVPVGPNTDVPVPSGE